MEEIKVGDYYRTKNGLIRKVETIKSGKRQFTRTTKTLVNGRHKLEDIKKHRKNIIDLIEVGDYVNGKKVKQIAMFEGFPDYPKLIFTDKKYLIPGETIENKDIKTIVTHEQMQSIEYKVEEDK